MQINEMKKIIEELKNRVYSIAEEAATSNSNSRRSKLVTGLETEVN
jgi:hypothetical protein